LYKSPWKLDKSFRSLNTHKNGMTGPTHLWTILHLACTAAQEVCGSTVPSVSINTCNYSLSSAIPNLPGNFSTQVYRKIWQAHKFQVTIVTEFCTIALKFLWVSQYETCFISHFWCLEFWGGFFIFAKYLCAPLG